MFEVNDLYNLHFLFRYTNSLFRFSKILFHDSCSARSRFHPKSAINTSIFHGYFAKNTNSTYFYHIFFYDIMHYSTHYYYNLHNYALQVAKEILDKYGSPEEQSKALKPFVPSLNVPGNAPTSPAPGSLNT